METFPPPVRSRRSVEGISAVLLPFTSDAAPDFDGLQDLLRTTWDAGLTPAVNMDTGFTNLLGRDQRTTVLELTRELAAGRAFVAGAYIEDQSGELHTLYHDAVADITRSGGTPILFPSSLLKKLSEDEVVSFHADIGSQGHEFIAFELGEMFLPFGRIYQPETYRRLLQIPQLRGIKHSSLDREQEWQRLVIRDSDRPDFRVYTGNDLAIDMIMYGSDYLLGLSAFHPEAFALRDRLWQKGDVGFYMLNDLLQYLGFFAFRSPVPAYKHSAAQFLKVRGVIKSDQTHARATRRPDTDVPILRDIAERLAALCAKLNSERATG